MVAEAAVCLAPHVRAQLDALVGAWPSAFPGSSIDVTAIDASSPPPGEERGGEGGLDALLAALAEGEKAAGETEGEKEGEKEGPSGADASHHAVLIDDDDDDDDEEKEKEKEKEGNAKEGGQGAVGKKGAQRADRVKLSVVYCLGKVPLVLLLQADAENAVPDAFFPPDTTTVQFALSKWYPVAGSQASETLPAHDAKEPLALFRRLAVLWRAYRGFMREAATTVANERVRFELESLGPMPDNEYMLASNGNEVHCFIRLPRDEPRKADAATAPPAESMELDLGTVEDDEAGKKDELVVAATQDPPQNPVSEVTERVEALDIAEDAGGVLPVDTAVFVSFSTSTGKVRSTRVVLPPLHPMAKALKTPPFPAEQGLHAYVADVREAVIKQTAQFGKSLEARRAFVNACLPVFGRPLDYDSYTYFVLAYAFFDVAERKRNFIAVIELPIDFPESPPKLTMRSLTNHMRAVEPENMPFSPRWTPTEMALRLQGFIRDTNSGGPAQVPGQYAAASVRPGAAAAPLVPPPQSSAQP